METIAVIVPAYNAAKYLKQCINSVKKQTFTNWRMIIVDDGSTDSTLNIAKKYARKDNRISIFHQNNLGSEMARKNGVNSKIAQECEYLTFLDADDEMYPDCLQRLYTEIQQHQADMAVGNIRRMIKHNVLWKHYSFSCMKIDKPRFYTHQEVINELLYGYYGPVIFPVVLYGKLYTRESITLAINSPAIVRFIGEDLSVTIRAVLDSTIVIIPADVYKYRIGGGTSKYLPNMLDDFLALYKLKHQIAIERKIPQDWKYAMDKELLAITQSCIQQCFLINDNVTLKAHEEAERICSETLVQSAALNVINREPDNEYAIMIRNHSIDELVQFNQNIVSRNAIRKRIKSLIMRI